MKFKQLGQTGVQVSELCFGTMSFGGDADADESARMFQACRDRGINFFDCADAYSKGAAETILGKLIKGSRDELVITSKCFVPMRAAATGATFSRPWKPACSGLARTGWTFC